MIWSSESRKIISKKLLHKNSFQVVGKRSRITLVENKLRIELNLQFINKLLFWCVIVGWIIMQFRSIQPFKRQPHKIVKHTQTIHRLSPTNCLSVFDHFVGLALKGLKLNFDKYTYVSLKYIRSGDREYNGYNDCNICNEYNKI